MGLIAQLDETIPVPLLGKRYDDSLLNAGSLALLDFSHPLTGVNSVPANGALINNIAWKQAQALLGLGTQSTLSWGFANNLTVTDGLVELTPKKGLHVITSQTTMAANRRMRINFPDPIRRYLADNPTRKIYFSIWARYTRLAMNGAVLNDKHNLAMLYDSALGSASKWAFWMQNNSNYIGAGKSLGANTPTPVLGNFYRNLAVDGWTGGSSSGTITAALTGYVKVGEDSPNVTLEVNKSPSMIIYRVYLEDLTASGRSYAQADADDLARYTRAFSTGRFVGDTFTNPATLP